MADLETIKVLLRSLLISSPHPLSIEELRRDYKKSEGEDCPFSALGYRNWITFLQSLTDTVQVLPNGVCQVVSTKATQHIQNMVAAQKKSKRKPFRNPLPPRFTYNRSGYSNYSARGRNSDSHMDRYFKTCQEAKQKRRMEELAPSKPMDEMCASYSETTDSHRSNVVYRPAGDLDADSDSSIDSFCDRFDYVRPSSSPECGRLEKPTGTSKYGENATYVCDKSDTRIETNAIENLSLGNTWNHTEFQDSPYSMSGKVSDVLKRNLRTILANHPDGVWACVLPEHYHDTFGVSLDWKELGYDSVCQMAHDLPDVFICKRIKSGDWKLFDAQRPLPVAYLDEKTSSLVTTVPESVCRRISSLAKEYPSGVRGIQFAQLYQEKYRKTLLTEAPGFKDIESLLLSLQDSCVHLRYVLKECYVYPVMNESEPDESPLAPLDKTVIQELGLYPDEVLGSDDQYPDAVLPADVKAESYLELIVAEVYHPHRFWVQLRKTNSLLEKLMDELNDFYVHHGDKYRMPESTIFPGQCCAALYCNEWHRACISSLKENAAMVFYVDYGTLIQVPKNELRFIHKDFTTLPKQAIRASLYGIKPPGGRKRFSDEANKAFLAHVTGKALVGMVYKANFEVPSLELFLIDTSGTTDLHLNDILVKDRHADYIPELEASQTTEETPENSSPEIPISSASPLPQVTSPPKQTSSAPDVQSQPFTQAWSGGRSPYLPPPGFHPSNIFSPAGSQIGMPAGLGTYNPAFAPGNHTLAAYSQAMAIQQQQSMMLAALYQNLLQQNMAAGGLLNAQPKATNLGSQLAGNTWFGNSMVFPQSHPTGPGSESNPALSSAVADPRIATPEIRLGALEVKTAESEATQNNTQTSNCSTLSNQDVSETGSSKSSKKKNKKKNKVSQVSSLSTSNSVLQLPQNSHSSVSSPGKTVGEIKQEMTDISDNGLLTSAKRNNHVNLTITRPLIETNSLNKLLSSKKETDEHVVVDCWEELADKGVCKEERSSNSLLVGEAFPLRNPAVSNMIPSHSPPAFPLCSSAVRNLIPSHSSADLPCGNMQINFWKEIVVDTKELHLFNIENNGYVSTDELAMQFTSFSNSSSILRVLEAIGVQINFLKVNRPQNLPLFSALDGCPDNLVSRLGLIRNKSGNVTGTFHLTPIDNIPSVLMLLGINEDNLIEEFQVLRDQFCEDPFWK